jgi:phosphoribosylformimino-5-aminoimidazole carboxamide ribotide isomerase
MIRIIPAIDVIGGKCVRLSQGAYDSKKVYHENPLDVAKMFEDQGIRYLHLVDLDGAKAKHVVNLKVLQEIASKTKLTVDFGGGIKSDNDIRSVFEAGAAQVTVGSLAVSNPEKMDQWLQEYGSSKIILGADVKDGRIAISGWQTVSSSTLSEFIAGYAEKGIQYIVCTDISKDGMLQGSSIDLYIALRGEFPALKFIASGGVSHVPEISRLNDIGMDGAIIGKAIYEGNISLNDLKAFIQ